MLPAKSLKPKDLREMHVDFRHSLEATRAGCVSYHVHACKRFCYYCYYYDYYYYYYYY